MADEFEYIRKALALQNPGYDPSVAMADEAEDTADSLSGYAMPSVVTNPVTDAGKQVQAGYLDMANAIGKQRAGAESSYDRLLKERTDMKTPQIDPFDQILGAMAPLAVAALGGEAGALSAPKAFEGYQGYLKEDLSRKQNQFNKLREENQLKLQKAESRRSDLTKSEADARNRANVEAIKLDAAERRAQISAARPSTAELEAATLASDVQIATDALEATRGKDGKYPSEKTEIFPLLEMTFRSNLAPVQAMQMFIKDPNVRQQISAEYQWLNTVLRDKTGAAINNGEYPSFSAAYFPRNGDNDATKSAKKRLRDQALSNYKFRAQRAGTAPLVEQEAPPPPKKQPSIQEMREALKKQQKGNQ